MGENIDLDAVARVVCAERCASYGDPPCWSLPDVTWDSGKCDNIHDCDCASIAKAVSRTVRPLPSPNGWKPDREAVARIIDPDVWRAVDRDGVKPGTSRDVVVQQSLDKADLILALPAQADEEKP